VAWKRILGPPGVSDPRARSIQNDRCGASGLPNQHDATIWIACAQRFKDPSRNSLPFLFRKHAIPQSGIRHYRNSMHLSTNRHAIGPFI
jgi:hypothetical protein